MRVVKRFSPLSSSPNPFRMLRAACLVLLFACVHAAAQVATIRFETFTSENGLSDNYVVCALQDSRGFLWFGTRDGLNRFDGYTFVTYRHDPGNPASLADGSAKCLYEDRRGRIWVGTHSSGLDCFNPVTEQFHHYRHNSYNAASIGDGPIAAVTEDTAGNIWAAARDRGHGVNMLDVARNRFTRFLHTAADPHSISSNKVVGLCRDRSGAIWVATSDSGLNRYDPSLCGFVNHHTIPAYRGSGWEPLDGISADRYGRLWVKAGTRLIRFDPNTGSWQEERFAGDFTAGRPMFAAVITDRNGTQWTAAHNRGVVARNPDWNGDMWLRNSPSAPNSLVADNVFCITEDNAGNIWFGTENGISRLNRRAWQFRFLQHDRSTPGSIAGPEVRTLAIDGRSALWLGTTGGGLDRLDKGATDVVHVPVAGRGAGYNALTVNTVFIDGEENVWFGTNNGLVRRSRNGERREWRNDPGDTSSIVEGGVWSILRDRRGRLWIGTLGGGISVMEESTGTFRRHRHSPGDPAGLIDNNVLTLFESRDGAIWAGTDKGLSRLDPLTGRWRWFENNVNNSTTLSNNRVWYLHEDRFGYLWIATSGGGVNRMNPATGKCRRYNEKDGLINNIACAIVEDNRGRMWVSTKKGISCIDPATRVIRSFGAADGLPVFEFHFKACARDSSGTIYFGGRGGVTCFNPDSLADNGYAPPVAITAFHALDTTFRLDSAAGTARVLHLDHDNNSFSIEFAALDFTNPAKNGYRYMLEGYDQDWRSVPASRRFAEYTSVSPGSYRFMVAGTNSDGVWNPSYGTLEIIIVPAWWQTWWFRVPAVLAGALVIAALLMMYIRMVRRKERTERRVIEYQLQALRAQMSPHFLFNSLNSILHFVVKRDIESAHFYLCTFSSLVRNTLENVRSDAVSLADELEMLRLYLEMESLRFRDRFTVSVNVAPEIDVDDVEIPPMIIQPYVENAIRHGLSHRKEPGRLSIDIVQRMGYLRFSIVDDGVGRKRSGEIQRNAVRDHREHGMAVTHNRLEALSRLHRRLYRVNVIDLVDDGGAARGTRIDILIPIAIEERTRITTPQVSI